MNNYLLCPHTYSLQLRRGQFRIWMNPFVWPLIFKSRFLWLLWRLSVPVVRQRTRRISSLKSPRLTSLIGLARSVSSTGGKVKRFSQKAAMHTWIGKRGQFSSLCHSHNYQSNASSTFFDFIFCWRASDLILLHPLSLLCSSLLNNYYCNISTNKPSLSVLPHNYSVRWWFHPKFLCSQKITLEHSPAGVNCDLKLNRISFHLIDSSSALFCDFAVLWELPTRVHLCGHSRKTLQETILHHRHGC